VSPARALQRRVPDRATLKTTSGAMVAVLRFFRVHARCAARLSCRAIKTLNFSSRLTPPWSAHIIQVP
jgi:hypothetical protein